MGKTKRFPLFKILRNHIMILNFKSFIKSIMISLMILTRNKEIIKLASKISEYAKFQYKEFLFFSKFIKPGDLCFDIGANIGIKTETFLRLKSNVISIEPQFKCVKKLHRRFLGINNIKILNFAVGPHKSQEKLFICDGCNTMSTLSEKFTKLEKYRTHNWSNYEIVNIITLDDLIKFYGIPKLCKIDVEGYELKVLQGLSFKIEYIIFEAHIEFIKEIEEIFNLLKRIGDFKVNFREEEYGDFFFNSWKTGEELLVFFQSMNKTGIFCDIMVKFNMG